jgi:hypothetical protein
MASFPVGLASHDGRMMVTSLIELINASVMMKRNIQVMMGQASNIPRARNLVMNQLRQAYPNQDHAWILWIDSDVLIPPGEHKHIVEAVQWAESTGKSWVANYKMSSNDNVLMSERKLMGAPHYTNEELDAMEPWAEVGMAGLGMAYLLMPTKYVFHADWAGEDIYFWLENPNLHIYYAKDIRLQHQKAMLLG